MTKYLATVGKESAEQFPVAAQAINDARDAAYKVTDDPVQRAEFVRITNDQMRTFEKQIGDHANEQASAYQEASKEEVTDNLHRALDFWHARTEKTGPRYRRKRGTNSRNEIKVD